MSHLLAIPRKTAERLAAPAVPGQRHTEMVKIAFGLISAHLPPEAVFQTLRPKYDLDVTDSEIRAVIRWAESRFQMEIGGGSFQHSSRYEPKTAPFSRSKPITASEPPEIAVNRLLGDFGCEEADLWERSPMRLTDSFNRDAQTLLTALYRPDERLNIVSARAVSGGKPHPIGTGSTRSQSEWVTEIARNGLPSGPSGSWIRPNPVNGSGVADADISAFRFLLLESDILPLSQQLSFFARLPLPISAIISSGGKSAHAWVKIEANSISEYREMSARIYSRLIPFGIDPANKNPSRLSRLPGVIREEGGIGDKRQKLLYLNPTPTNRRIFE